MQLDHLNSIINAHDACTNRFFEYIEGGLQLEDLRKICPEYLSFTSAFPGILAGLVSSTRGGVQFYLVSILYSELGSGVESKAHSRLFRTLCEEVGISDVTDDVNIRLPSTKALVHGLHQIYHDGNQVIQGLGAQYALEFQADHMLKEFRKAFAWFDWPGSKGSEGLIFFEVHRSDEPDHSDAMRMALMRYIKEEDQLKEAEKGARKCLDLLAGFWEGLYETVNGGASKR
ncbi:iron-containing redox enzyme family protein [Paraburkholderia sp. MM6662-R1]|uniref:iron-containing redox enzyme family protein n=1 Tax=Paraburkholderia sp. MM6662-R1 TaxID=2991066 RepID=UPI003D256329